jgi:hypothetical protein
MSPYARVRGWSAVFLIVVLLVGLLVRKRSTACVSWTLYLGVVAGTDVLILSWPERFWRQDFWALKEGVLNVLKLAIGFELMVRIFGHFPAAYANARRGLIAVTGLLLALAASSLSAGTDYVSLVGRVQWTINEGTVWLLVALGAFCLWYHLPLDSIPKAILVGLVPYLLVYSVVLRALVTLGWERGKVFNFTAPIAYVVLLLYWARAAWRRAPDDDAGTRVARMVGTRA